jgi:hypothetical protein
MRVNIQQPSAEIGNSRSPVEFKKRKHLGVMQLKVLEAAALLPFFRRKPGCDLAKIALRALN